MYQISHEDVYDEDDEFFPNKALAILLIEDVVFCNSFWYNKSWPEAAQQKTNLFVSCNDVFFWGASDAESIDYVDIEDIYKHWVRDEIWGPAIWCIKHRKLRPQPAVYETIKIGNLWDIDLIINNFTQVTTNGHT